MKTHAAHLVSTQGMQEAHQHFNCSPRLAKPETGHMRTTRCLAVVLMTLVASMAAASDDAATGSLPTSPEQMETAQSAPVETANDDYGSGETKVRLLDRRDRIFYPGDTERLEPLGRKLFLNILL